MKKLTDKEIKDKLKEVFDEDFKDSTVEIEQNTDEQCVFVIKRMYEYISYSLPDLIKISEIFGTQNINDERYSYGGCETCDWGSSYEVTFIIKPEVSK